MTKLDPNVVVETEPDVALESLEHWLRDGFCFVDGIEWDEDEQRYRVELYRETQKGDWRAFGEGDTISDAIENAITAPMERAPDMSGQPVTGGALDIARERTRQLSGTGENYRPSHDDLHVEGELVDMAICYAAARPVYYHGEGRDYMRFFDPWPFDRDDDKRDKHDRIKRLTIAGALLAAEIDRLRRIEACVEKSDDE